MLHDLTLLAPKPVINIAPNRRQLLGSTAAVALLAGVMTTAAGRQAFAGDLSNEQKLTLLAIAKDIYPHDPSLVEDKYYQATVDAIAGEAAKDAKVAEMVTKGLADLDARANAAYGSGYTGIKDYGKREGLLRAIQLTDFFQKIRGGLLFGLYNNKELYPKFGYDGSSWEKGGFINDPSFGKADWL
jgi:hypothetical protein